MKNIIALFLLFCAATAWGANPAFSDFNSNQFGTSGNKVAVKDGARITNEVAYGQLTIQDHFSATNTSKTNTISGLIQQQGVATSAGAAAFGLNTVASGNYAFVTGIGNTSGGVGSLVGGQSNTVSSSATASLVGGFNNSAFGLQNFSMGSNNIVDGAYGAAIGRDITFDAPDSAALGNTIAIGRNISVLNNGTNNFVFNSSATSFSTGGRSNAFLVNAPGGIVLSGAPNGGNVGIGTTGPLNKLDVAGAAVIGSGYAGVNTAPANGLLVEGNVGFGITTPTNKLHIRTTSSGEQNLLILDNDGGSAADAAGILFNVGGSPGQYSTSKIIATRDGGGVGSYLRFYIGNTANTLTESLVLDENINVIVKNNAQVGGYVVATNGVFSYRSNLLAAATITVGASPSSWTNTLSPGCSVNVYVDSSLGATTVALNGTTLFGSFAGTQTVGLQPGEYITLTYIAVAPSATFKPFP